MLLSHSEPEQTEYSSETFNSIKKSTDKLFRDFKIAVYYGVMKAAGNCTEPSKLLDTIDDKIYNTISSFNEKSEFMDGAPKIVDYTIAADDDLNHMLIKVYFRVGNNLFPMDLQNN